MGAIWKAILWLLEQFSARKRKQREIEHAQEVTDTIAQEVQNVEKPDLDQEADSEDPMGVDRWNRGGRGQ